MAEAALQTGRVRMTQQEYLRFERDAETRHEFVDGEVIDMAGNVYKHTVITMNAGAKLHRALEGTPCAVSDSNLRVRIPRKACYRHADVVVVCGEPRFDPDDLQEPRAVTNPAVLVEVLSPSTESADRGVKAKDYRAIDALQVYLLVAQDEPHVEAQRRAPDGRWVIESYAGLDAVVPLGEVGAALALRDVYARVTFDASIQDA